MFLSTNTKAQISTGPGRHSQQYVAVSFRSFGRLQKRFLKKAALTLWNRNPGVDLQGSVKSQASESVGCFGLWGPGPVVSSAWVAAASPETIIISASEGCSEGDMAP